LVEEEPDAESVELELLLKMEVRKLFVHPELNAAKIPAKIRQKARDLVIPREPKRINKCLPRSLYCKRCARNSALVEMIEETVVEALDVCQLD
jgi:hypothetical protein